MYGAAMVLVLHNVPQFETIYGDHITKIILDLYSTKVLFRVDSYKIVTLKNLEAYLQLLELPYVTKLIFKYSLFFNISERTVEQYLKNAKQKLGTTKDSTIWNLMKNNYLI
jgi:type IV secretory pathway TraG/TraD family ATPase VirD4